MSCVSQNPPCEDILEVKRQTLQCERWRKIMNNNNFPQQGSTAKDRYQQECQNLRFIEMTSTRFVKATKRL